MKTKVDWSYDLTLTKIITGKHGLLYNNIFEAYDIEKMSINVFDTPGFFDSDECRNKENKKQIASQIGNKIDMFAYFMTADNKRMDSNIQNVFTILQEWTLGMEQIFKHTQIEVNSYPWIFGTITERHSGKKNRNHHRWHHSCG